MTGAPQKQMSPVDCDRRGLPSIEGQTEAGGEGKECHGRGRWVAVAGGWPWPGGGRGRGGGGGGGGAVLWPVGGRGRWVAVAGGWPFIRRAYDEVAVRGSGAHKQARISRRA